jgi:hypothetical protein
MSESVSITPPIIASFISFVVDSCFFTVLLLSCRAVDVVI